MDTFSVLEGRCGGAALPCASRGRRDSIRACSFRGQRPQLERAARCARYARSPPDDGAVLPQHDIPADADAVLIDLELDLDPAVLFAQLDLGSARTGAATCAAKYRARNGVDRDLEEALLALN